MNPTAYISLPTKRLLIALVWLACGALPVLAQNPGAGRQPQDSLVARVNGQAIRLSDVYDSIENLSLGDQIDVRGELQVYIEALINEEVLFQWALNNASPEGKKLRSEIKDLVVRHLIERFVHSRIKVPESEVRAYYDNNPSLVRGEHVRVRTILLNQRAQCERLFREIDSEEKFAELAEAHSLDKETAGRGGDSGLLMRGEGQRSGYELKYFDMKVGEMRIFDIPRGCLLVRSVFYTNPPLPPYEAVRGQLREYLEGRQERLLVETLVQSATKTVQVQRFYESR